MLIERNNFDHDPPWKYAVVAYLAKSKRKKSCGSNVGKYITLISAFQAVDSFRENPDWDWAEIRIEHVYYEQATTPPNKDAQVPKAIDTPWYKRRVAQVQDFWKALQLLLLQKG